MANDEDEFVSVGEPIPQLKSVTAGTARTVNIVWVGGRTSTIDLAPHIAQHWAFAPLADDTIFANVQADDWGWAIFWPDAPNAAIPTSTLEALERNSALHRSPAIALSI